MIGELLKVLFLGVVQGFTEFLPISSSGHLVIVQKLIPWLDTPGIFLEVVLHLGTLFSILFYYRKFILKIGSKYILYIIVGSIPAGLVGIIFENFFESLFESVIVVGVALFITGILNLTIDRLDKKKHKLSIINVLIIGIFQAVAIIPGISRSGSTIFAGRNLGISKEEAVRFSFLLSIPAILGANLLQIFKSSAGPGLFNGFYLIGFLTAFLSGYLAIHLVYRTIASKRFSLFGYYCLGLGLLTLILSQ